tara:strand:- start:3658 stop:4821 length:1164 start_codon:yes stop_codon:yes gene_type:complete
MNKSNLSKLSNSFEGQKMFEIYNRTKKIKKKIFHFELGQPSHPIPKKIIKETINSLKLGRTKYVSSKGVDELLEIIRDTTKFSRGFKPDLNQILVTPGANSIIYLSMKCICNPGDEVILPDPGFPTYISAAKSLGLKIKFIKLREKFNFQLNIEELKSMITNKTRLLILNSPSNPLGTIINKNQYQDIYNLIEKKNIFLLSDEIYSRIVYSKNDFFSPSSFDKCKSRVIILNGFSKAFSMTGYRLGVAIGPKKLISKMHILLETIVSCVPPFIQYAGVEAIKTEKNFIKKEIKIYIEKQKLFTDFFSSTNLINCVKPEGAFYLFPNVKKIGMSGDEFAKVLLNKLGIAVVPGSYFGKNGKYNVRIAYTNSKSDIKKSIKLIKNYFKL